MSIRWRNRMTVISFLLAFFVVGSVANATWNEPLSFNGTMVFSALCIMWTVSVRARITKRRERRYFTCLGGFMLMLMIERAIKFSFFLQNEWLVRHFWYSYYIPLTLMPLISLMLALSVGKTDAEPLNPRRKFMYLPAALLIAGFLTNDSHQLAFRFRPAFENWTNDYSYGILYYLVLAWIIALVIASLVIIVRFSTVNGSKRLGFVPLAVIVVSLAGVAVYIFTDFRYTRIMNMPELFCFCVAAFWEACLQTGLIPSNTGYDLLFRHSHLAATIRDDAGKTVYQTAISRQADASYIAHKNRISGGEIEWLEDVTVVTRQQELLERANTELAEKAEIRQKETSLREERTRIEEQKKLYDKMNASFEPQTLRIRALVAAADESEEMWKRNMPWVCVIGAYIKRKSNLILLAAKNEAVSLTELYLAYNESLNYLAKAGVKYTINTVSDAAVSSGLLIYAYDEFETLIERKMPAITNVDVHIMEKENSIFFDIKIDETPLNFAFDKVVRV